MKRSLTKYNDGGKTKKPAKAKLYFTVDDLAKGENYVTPEYLKEVDKRRNDWNEFVEFLKKENVYGSEALDKSGAGLGYLKKWNKANPDKTFTEEDIKDVQYFSRKRKGAEGERVNDGVLGKVTSTFTFPDSRVNTYEMKDGKKVLVKSEDPNIGNYQYQADKINFNIASKNKADVSKLPIYNQNSVKEGVAFGQDKSVDELLKNEFKKRSLSGQSLSKPKEFVKPLVATENHPAVKEQLEGSYFDNNQKVVDYNTNLQQQKQAEIQQQIDTRSALQKKLDTSKGKDFTKEEALDYFLETGKILPQNKVQAKYTKNKDNQIIGINNKPLYETESYRNLKDLGYNIKEEIKSNYRNAEWDIGARALLSGAVGIIPAMVAPIPTAAAAGAWLAEPAVTGLAEGVSKTLKKKIKRIKNEEFGMPSFQDDNSGLTQKREGGYIEYPNGGKVKPIVVNNPNDPRLKAYNDSLYVRTLNTQTFKPGNKTRPLTKEEKDFWKDKKTGLVPNVVEYDPNYPGSGYFGHYKKPVQPVVYQPATAEQIKPLYQEPQLTMPERLELNMNRPNVVQSAEGPTFKQGRKFMRETGLRPGFYEEGGKVGKDYPSGKIEGEKSKEKYINYLKSKPYFLTASQQWGAAKAQQMVNKQIEDVKNTPIEYWKDMDMQTRIDYLQDPSLAGYHKIEDKIFNYESNPEYDIHELSHSTDSNIRDLPKDIFSTKSLYNDRTGSYQGKKYIFNRKYLDDDSIAEGIMNINPNYFEYNKFQQYGDDNLEYLSKPTEVRARVNTLRNDLIKNNINYHNLNQDQFNDYVNKNINNVDYNINSPVRIDNFKTTENPFEKKEMPYQQQNLEELKIGIGNKKPLLDVLKLYGSNNTPNNNLPIAAYGGTINNMKKRTLKRYTNGGPSTGSTVSNNITVGGQVAGAAAPLIGALIPDKNYTDSEGNDLGSRKSIGESTLEYGASGAAMGSMLGPVGTLVGAGLGAGYGAVKGWMEKDEMEKKQKEANFRIDQRNLSNRMNNNVNWGTPGINTSTNMMFARGGMVLDYDDPNANAELELQETFQMPDGTVGNVDGPSHEMGGIAVDLPEGTRIWSDKLKHNGKTFAKHTKPITNKIARLEKQIAKNPANSEAKENSIALLNDQLDYYFDTQETNKQNNEMKRTFKNGGMIKRADGSYSKRGLWDNIRANRGSGKKPTPEMLKQERKIRAQEKEMGGYIYAEGGINNPGFRALPEEVQQKILARMEMGGYMYPMGGSLMEDNMFAEGGKLPKNILQARLESHMSADEADAYLDEYGKGGYTVRRSNDRKGKTHVVIGPDGTKKYFGDPNLGERGKSKYGKEAFYARHKKNLDKNPYFRAYAKATWEDGGMVGDEYAEGGIHIKPENKGKFTAYAKSHGKGVQEMARTVLANKENYSPTIVKRANFAKNAASWKHEMGGLVKYRAGGPFESDEEYVTGYGTPIQNEEVIYDENMFPMGEMPKSLRPTNIYNQNSAVNKNPYRSFYETDANIPKGQPIGSTAGAGMDNLGFTPETPGFFDKAGQFIANNPGLIGQLGTAASSAATQMNRINKLARPRTLADVRLSDKIANPNLVDYSAERNAIDRAALNAMSDAQRGFGSSAAAQAFKNKARLNQLEGTGRSFQSQENANAQIRNQFLNARNEAAMREAMMNNEIAKYNLENVYGYDTMTTAQKNAITAMLGNTASQAFGKQTEYANQLNQANILANQYDPSVINDMIKNGKLKMVDGKYVRGRNGGTIKKRSFKK